MPEAREGVFEVLIHRLGNAAIPARGQSAVCMSYNLASFLPTSMNTAALQARLQPLFESLKRTQQLIARLSKLPAQPGFLLNDSNGESRDELSDEIHQSLKEQEDEFDLIQQEAEDLTGSSSWARRKDSGSSHSRERERADLASLVTRLGEDLKMYDGISFIVVTTLT